MSSSLQNQKPVSKLFGLPRPLAGALIGSLIFLLILLPLKFLNYESTLLYLLALNLELLGRMTILTLSMLAKIDMPEIVANIMSITISTIPAWIAGWQIGSKDKATRRVGFIFLVVYLCFIMVFGMLLTLVGI